METGLSKTERYIIAGLFLLFIGVALLRIFTEKPSGDEAYFATPGLNLVSHGYMGASNLDASNPIQTGINQHSYWTVPLYFLMTAGWYELVGFGLFRARLLPLLCSIGGLFALYYLARRLTNSFQIGWVAAALMGLSYTYIQTATYNRMDSACACFGLAGLAVYLWKRESHLTLAVFLSQSLIAASGLTHPDGILYFCALAFLTLYYDRRRIGMTDLLVAGVPYMVGALGWWLYIRYDPQEFVAQFMGSFHYHHVSLFTLEHLKAEIVNRYLGYYGIYGAAGFARLRSVQLLTYVAAILAALFISRIRSATGTRVALIVLLIMCVGLSFIDGIQTRIYLIHITPWFSLLLAITAVRLVEAQVVRKPVIVAALCLFVVLQLMGVAYIASQRSLWTAFLPATDFIRANAAEPVTIFGSSELGFEIGFGPRLMDDPTLGFWSGKRADVVVVDNNWSKLHWPSMQHDPRGPHIDKVLSRCRVSYHTDAYLIYRCE